MKKIAYLVIAVSLLSLFSCLKKNEAAELIVSPPSFKLDSTVGDTSLRVKLYYTNNWSAQFDDPTWCTVSPASGTGYDGLKLDSTVLTINVKANTTGKTRENILNIQSAHITNYVYIRQEK